MPRGANESSSIPRTDVFGAGLAGSVMVFVGMILNGDAFNFHAVAGALTALIVFAAGYAPERHKNVLMSVAAFVAIILSYVLGLILGVQGDQAALSSAIVGLVMALVGVLAPPNAQTEALVGGRDAVNAAGAPGTGPIARDTPPRPGIR